MAAAVAWRTTATVAGRGVSVAIRHKTGSFSRLPSNGRSVRVHAGLSPCGAPAPRCNRMVSGGHYPRGLVASQLPGTTAQEFQSCRRAHLGRGYRGRFSPGLNRDRGAREGLRRGRKSSCGRSRGHEADAPKCCFQSSVGLLPCSRMGRASVPRRLPAESLSLRNAQKSMTTRRWPTWLPRWKPREATARSMACSRRGYCQNPFLCLEVALEHRAGRIPVA